MSSQLKWSHYNLVDEIENGLLVYNTATGAVLKITDPVYCSQIRAIMEHPVSLDSIPEPLHASLIEPLVHKRVLVDPNVNEYDLLTYMYNNRIVRNTLLELTLVITRQCNYRCVYCYEDHLDLPMTPEIYQRILRMIEEGYQEGLYSGVSISLFGGEPFLEYDLVIRFLKAANDLSEKYQKTFSAGATTNGSLLFPERFLQLHALNCRHFQITVDGMRDTHDQYRIATDGNGWDVVIDNLKFMASTNLSFDVTVRTNFNDDVLNSIQDFYEFMSSFLDDRFDIYYEDIKHLGGDNDENVDVLDTIASGLSMVDISSLIGRNNLRNNVCGERLTPFSHICQATKYNSFIVDYDGSLLKCTLDFNNEANRIGRISEKGEMLIDHEKHCRWLTVGFENNDCCKSCKLLPLCYGRSCVSSALTSKQISCNPDLETLLLMEQIKSHYLAVR